VNLWELRKRHSRTQRMRGKNYLNSVKKARNSWIQNTWSGKCGDFHGYGEGKKKSKGSNQKGQKSSEKSRKEALISQIKITQKAW
jgi:hypothetical protein